MRLLDRLDAIDRRLGLARRPPRKPPNRRTRWMAGHQWATAFVWGMMLTAVCLLTGLLLDRDTSLATVLIQGIVGFVVGLVVATTARGDCEAWDRRSEA